MDELNAPGKKKKKHKKEVFRTWQKVQVLGVKHKDIV